MIIPEFRRRNGNDTNADLRSERLTNYIILLFSLAG